VGAVIGIDVGAYRLHCVAVDQSSSYGVAVFSADELGRLSTWAREAVVIAIDAPAQLSTEPHAGDEGLPPKFR
jgi:predicted nuclease with RNAse H fold